MTKGIWKFLHSSWPGAPTSRKLGYAALVPVPGDLPVFLRIALATLNAQENSGLVETLVIPDKPSAKFAAAFERERAGWKNGPLRLVELGAVDRFITRRINSPHTNHWLQMVRGVAATTSTHALLHDADLFITDRSFLANQYARITECGMACLGVNPVWDPWYSANGFGHVTATWELMFEAEWARSFKPWMHRGHWGEVAGKGHEFDTMLLPQCLTEPSRIARHEGKWGFVHFNYVICTYRWFKESKGAYADVHWRILLIRLLVDAYESVESEEDVPSLAELRKGLSDAPRRVDYRGEEARKNYSEFRGKLAQLMESGVLDEGKVGKLRDRVAAFDAAMQWEPSAHRPAVVEMK